jgi:hypothetical protein
MPLPPGYNPFANQGANLYAGVDPATGNPFYIAGYDANNQPVWSWSPTFDPAENGGAPLNRAIGHFADANASGGQFGQLGEFVSNAQGSMYTPNTGLSGPPLTQTGSYVAPGGANNQPPPVVDQQPPPPVDQGQQQQRQGQQANYNPSQPTQINTGQNDPYSFFGGGQSQRTSTNPYVNQSGPFQGGASNQAVYGNPGRTSRVPWQMRLQGGGGIAGDTATRSGSRLF